MKQGWVPSVLLFAALAERFARGLPLPGGEGSFTLLAERFAGRFLIGLVGGGANMWREVGFLVEIVGGLTNHEAKRSASLHKERLSEA